MIENAAYVVGILAGLMAVGVYGWWLWVHAGLREFVVGLVQTWLDRRNELARIRRMWGTDAG